MKKISCVGYHATGSGAVDDFLREFDNISAADYGIECRFLQDPDGIADLEYNLVENPHRLNSGFALKRFLKFAKDEERTYRHVFGDYWMTWAKEYVDALTDFTYKGYWHGDVRLLKPVSLFIYKFRKAINLCLPKKIRKNKYYNYLPNITTMVSNIDRNQFLEITKKYCDKLCEKLNKEEKEYVVLDQAISPENPMRYMEYIDQLKVIIVDRDPRDVYLNDIIINGYYVQPKDPHQFCQVFKASRKVKDLVAEEGKVLRINFEDIIYKYDETTKRIMDFLNISSDKHINKKQFFNPDLSKKNTMIWKKRDDCSEQLAIIEQELSEFLYDYSE